MSIARHQLMFLNLAPMQDTDYSDTLDERPFVFEIEPVDNPLDADDPEAGLSEYYRRTFNT